MPTTPSRVPACLRSALFRGLAAGLVGALLTGVLTTSLAAAAERGDRGDRGAAGIGDRYFPLDGNGGLDVVSYRIDNRYQFARERLSGHTRLVIEATHDLSSFNLDFLLPVARVRVDGVRARSSQRRHELTITPRQPIAAGERFTVGVAYAGRPGRYGYAGEHNWLADRHEVVAMNQPHMAPWWFPANDHPSDKALMDISITVPRGTQAFANGERVSRTRHGRLVTHRFRAEEPMATYLAMFAAGDFRVERGSNDGLPYTLAVSKRLSPHAERANLRLMRQTPRIVEGLEADLGDYPFSSVGGLVTGLDVGFALENQTLPTYPETGRGYTWLVVHELAHQWFGDSVSLRRWRDIWLNEGAASFMEVRWEETHGGQSGSSWLRDQYDARPEASTFWDTEIGDPGADRLFAGAVYTRGAMTFQALRNRIGEDAFWTLLRRWVDERRNGLGTRAAFVALAEEVSGRELDRFFRVWLDLGRKPADVAANGLGSATSR